MNMNITAFRHATRFGRVEADDPCLQPFLTFADRADYLVWVAEWKGALGDAVSGIRRAKRERRDPARQDFERNAANQHRQDLRVASHNLFSLRAAAKARARMAYAARHERIT